MGGRVRSASSSPSGLREAAMHASHPWLARAGHVKPQPGRSWLITFSDLICLLLSFFVLLYAMRAPDARKFDRVRAALAHLPPAAAPPGGRFDVGVPPERAPPGADYLAPLLARHFAAEPALLPVHIERGEDRV